MTIKYRCALGGEGGGAPAARWQSVPRAIAPAPPAPSRPVRVTYKTAHHPYACHACRAMETRPSVKPYLWQRGLSLYYARRFADAAEQFRADVAVNPNDTEEAIWAYLAEAQLLGAAQARQQLLQARHVCPTQQQPLSTFALFTPRQPACVHT